MAISKSTPYVRYKKDFTSSLHLGTIHIESEYLDRTQKTTIESIHGMTWHNKVVNENKELNLLSDTQLELTELEKQYWNTGEKRVSVDEIHTLEEVEPNEDGTYTYTVNSMEGEYIEIYDGINNITSTSDGLDGQFEIVYDTTEEDVSGNIALDQVAPQYEITDSGVGTITGAKSTGLTLVNHITEPSKEEVATIQEYEGQHFTINNTVQGNIKSAILKGDTALNRARRYSKEEQEVIYTYNIQGEVVVSNNPTPLLEGQKIYMSMEIKISELSTNYPYLAICTMRDTGGYSFTVKSNAELHEMPKNVWIRVSAIRNVILGQSDNQYSMVVMVNNSSVSDVVFGKIATRKPMWINLSEKFGMGNEPTREQCDEMFEYFEGMQSVKMPVLTTTGKNLFNPKLLIKFSSLLKTDFNKGSYSTTKDTIITLKPNTEYKIIYRTNNTVSLSHSYASFGFKTGNDKMDGLSGNTSFYSVQNNVTTDLKETWITTDDTGNLYMFRLDYGGADGYINDVNLALQNTDIHIEEASAYTEYEPYKSTTLSVNEEVELRGIGDVKDELNLETGELVENFGNLYFDGSENWNIYNRAGTMAIAKLNLPNLEHNFNANSSLADTVPVVSQAWTGAKGISLLKQDVHLAVEQSIANTDDDLKKWISSIGGINLIYRLSQSTVKTVDLTVQNQDGSTIPHIQTQPTITYVSTSSDVLTPTVEMSCQYDTIIKPNTTYTIKLDRPNVSDTMYLQVDLGGTMMMLDADVNAFTIKTPSTLSHSQLRLSGTGNTVKEIIVLEGNRVNDKIEYFEGMKNVENPILIVNNCPYVFGKGGRL